jgi:alpha-galactosidase
MLMWHEHESAEAVAYQIICCLYSVPQISVLLDKLSDEHRKILKFWMNYWRENREVLLYGSFTADAPELLYAQERCARGAALIATAYTDPILKVDELLSSFDFINATKDSRLWIDVRKSLGTRSYVVYDCRGNEMEKGQIDLSAGIHGFEVPRSGMLRIYK